MFVLRVVKPVQQMDRAGSRRREAHASTASQLRVRARGEGRDLLVPALDELDGVDLVEGAEDAVDAIPGIAVDLVDPPLVDSVQQMGSDGFGHALRLPGADAGK